MHFSMRDISSMFLWCGNCWLSRLETYLSHRVPNDVGTLRKGFECNRTVKWNYSIYPFLMAIDNWADYGKYMYNTVNTVYHFLRSTVNILAHIFIICNLLGIIYLYRCIDDWPASHFHSLTTSNLLQLQEFPWVLPLFSEVLPESTTWQVADEHSQHLLWSLLPRHSQS